MPRVPDTPQPLTKVAEALVRHAPVEVGHGLRHALLFKRLNIKEGTFRGHARSLGYHENEHGLAFFRRVRRGEIAFGPGAGLAVGISLGSSSLRVTITDANGWTHVRTQANPDPDQLTYAPPDLLDRMREVVWTALAEAFEIDALLVDGNLPLLGWAVAWQAPISRRFRLVSRSLRSREWRNVAIDELVKDHFDTPVRFSYALNDAAAVAVALAYHLSHGTVPVDDLDNERYEKWTYPRLCTTLRLGGGVGSASIIVEPPHKDPENEQRSLSGFPTSILVAGIDKCAGEIGHIPANEELVAQLNAVALPEELGPLEPVACSCSIPAVTHHLESYTSAHAVTHRLAPTKPMNEVLRWMRDNASNARVERVLSDAGALLGDALVGPVAALNPASITLTGSVAMEPLGSVIAAKLRERSGIARTPLIRILKDDENFFAAARGAGLALIRREVHRQLEHLLGEDAPDMEGRPNDFLAQQRIEDLTYLFSKSSL
jgi:predicted NBD/HSP70 family sugar kinase